jgi:hypothetical protein
MYLYSCSLPIQLGRVVLRYMDGTL